VNQFMVNPRRLLHCNAMNFLLFERHSGFWFVLQKKH
jgi:hypothetical protein